MKTKNFFIKIASICGIGAIVFDLSLITFFGFLTPNYDPLKQYISELGSRYNPYSSLINIWWGFYSFLIIIFAIGLYKGIKKNQLSWLGPLMIAIEALTNGALSGLFSCDIGCTGNSFSNQMHVLTSGIGTIISVFIPSFLLISIVKDKKWKQIQPFLIVIQIVMIVIVIYPFYREYLLIFFDKEYGYAGFYQRLYTLIYYLSLLIPAKLLYGLSKNS